MNLHIAVDSKTGHVRIAVLAAANVSDQHPLLLLLHRVER